MKTSALGTSFIAAHEGVVLKAYPDPATGGDPWTIGVGHTSLAGLPMVVPGMTITRGQAFEILARDLGTFEVAVRTAVRVPLTQNEFDALVSFTFNVGGGNLRRSTLLRKLNAGDKAGAAAESMKWNKAGKPPSVMAGLTRRRAEEKSLFLHGDYAGVTTDIRVPDPRALLKRGSTGKDVSDLQTKLKKLGYNITVDGAFGGETEDAVNHFQVSRGLTVDGKVGKATKAALAEALDKPADADENPQEPVEPKVTEGTKGTMVGAALVGLGTWIAHALGWL